MKNLIIIVLLGLLVTSFTSGSIDTLSWKATRQGQYALANKNQKKIEDMLTDYKHVDSLDSLKIVNNIWIGYRMALDTQEEVINHFK